MCVKLHIDKKIFKVFKAMGKQQSKAKRNLITKLANETHCKYRFEQQAAPAVGTVRSNPTTQCFESSALKIAAPQKLN